MKIFLNNMIRTVLMTISMIIITGTASAKTPRVGPPDPDMGAGIYKGDFKIFDLNGRLLFVDDRAILSLIGTFEGPSGYDTIYNGSRVKPEKPITTMTIDEVLNWQARSVGAGAKSSAAGVYQFIQDSLRDTAKRAGIERNALFDRYTQDRLARSALRNCGFYRHDVADEVIGNCLAGTWAALPLVTGPNAGKSRYHNYAGNKSLTSIETVMNTVRGRFRDIEHASALLNAPRGVVSVQKITNQPVTSAHLIQEKSSVTGEIIFSVSKPDPEELERQKKERYRLNLAERAAKLQPFNGYVKAAPRYNARRYYIREIPMTKNNRPTQ